MADVKPAVKPTLVAAPKAYSYSETLKWSFIYIFKNYQVFIPMIIMTVIGLVMSPLQVSLLASGIAPTALVVWIILLAVVMLLLSMYIGAWQFTLIRHIINKESVSIFGSLKTCWRLALRLTGFTLLFYLAMLVFMFITANTAGRFLDLGGFGLLLGVISILVIVTALIMLMAALLHLAPVLTLENQGVMQSIKIIFRHFWRNKGHSFALLGITIVLILLSYIPFMMGLAAIGPEEYGLMAVTQPFLQMLITTLLSIPSYIVILALLMMYFLSYQRKRV